MEMTEHQLIDSILSGNSNAFGILVDRYSRMCFSIAFRISNQQDEAQDIVQESFISAYENLKDFKKDSKFSTWLYRITLNKSLAAKKKQTFFSETENLEVEEEKDDSEIIERSENELRIALTALNEKERLIIDLFYYQEQSIREISIICTLSEANVKVILHRARKKMEETMKGTVSTQ